MKRQFLAILLGTGLALTACTGAAGGGVESSNPPPATSGQPKSDDNPTTVEPSPAPTKGRELLLRDVKCTADESGSWSFDGYLVNDQKQQRTFTIAIAVTVGMEVKGHDLVVEEVPGNSELHVTKDYFAQADEKDAVCEPVVSVEG